MNAHTPGTWEAVPLDTLDIRWGVGANDQMVAEVYTQAGVLQLIANARLIAAAPDLHDAAMLALEWLNDYVYDHPEDVETRAIGDALIAAIKKANGEA